MRSYPNAFMLNRLLIAFFLMPFAEAKLCAQVELNAGLRPGHVELEMFLRQYPDAPEGQQAEALAGRYPFLRAYESVQALAPAVNEAGINRLYTIRMPGNNVQAAIANLQASGAFEFVEENRIRKIHMAHTQSPNDDSVQIQWYHRFVRTFEAWEQETGKPDVRIGVIDTGLDFGHPELEGQVAINTAEDRNGNGRFDPWPHTEQRNGVFGDFDGADNDGNGYIDDVAGFDFTDQPRSPFGGDYLEEDGDPADDNGHGTLVAGVIAARANNGAGGTGIAPGCRIVVLRAFAANGAGEDDDIARAIVYAADNGIGILNFSFGDIYPSRMMQEAIRYAHRRSVVMVASAGNGTGDELHYPSGFPEVISVSASALSSSDNRELLWPLSSYGLTVDLCAPGAGIFCPTLRDTAEDGKIRAYGRFSGTSVAAPMVAAAAGLVFSQRGPVGPEQMRGLFCTTTDDISLPGWDHYTGAGRLNIETLLQATGAPTAQILSPAHDSGSPADSVWMLGTVLDPGFERYELSWQAGTEDLSPWNTISANGDRQLLNDTLGLWLCKDLPDGEYTLRLQVWRRNGATLEHRVRFVRDRTPPLLELKVVANVWDNERRSALIVFRSDDPGQHSLHFRKSGSAGAWRQIVFDRNTRNGEFLLDENLLSAGDWTFYINSTNLAGLSSESRTDTFAFVPASISRSGYSLLNYSLPMGRPLPGTYDFNRNGFPEVVINEYTPSLSFGKLRFYEFNGGFFSLRDSISFKPVLIPKDVADTDGDGLLELLCSVNDSSYVLEQAAQGLFPKNLIYSDFTKQRFSANWFDSDGDGQLEMIVKDFKDYHILKGGGSSYALAASLPDVSPDYIGSVAPRTATGDFDGDGKPEIAFGDFDGDLMTYEYDGGAYRLTLLDTSELTKSGSYITAGDFDGDSIKEIFVATHSSPLRNSDFEYDPPYWHLRIFKGNGDNTYEVVWQDWLYDVDTENYNACTAGNLDEDPAEEIVFSSFPRTYIIEHNRSDWEMSWFFYGAIGTQHLIADFNGNGINELGLGRGDSILFWEKQIAGKPLPVTSLQGTVRGPDKVLLSWESVAGAQEYQLVQFPMNGSSGIAYRVTGTRFMADVDLQAGQDYLFTVRSIRGSDTSAFGNFIIRKPHELPRLDSLHALTDRQLELFFSWPVTDRERDKAYFVLNGTQSPVSIIHSGNAGQRLLLSFEKAFTEGQNFLAVDSAWLDVDWAVFAGGGPFSFGWQPKKEDALFLLSWRALDGQHAELVFNYPIELSALQTANFRLSPAGTLESVQYAAGREDAVIVRIGGAQFGALGYPLSITVLPAVCSPAGVCIYANRGDVATFAEFRDDLSQVYVYPNPVVANPLFEGVRFANLTRQARIRVMTASGRLVHTFEERNGDGGYTWNLHDQSGQRVPPGVYLYHISADGLKDAVGKFSVAQ